MQTYVQFKDASEQVVVSIFGGAQDPEVYPHQGMVGQDDARLMRFLNPVRIPQTVSKFQGMAALHQAGHLDGVEAYMADASTPFLTRLAWQQVQVFERSSPMLNGIAQLRGLSDAEVDQLFIVADGIKA